MTNQIPEIKVNLFDKSQQKRIIIDMDGVLADLMSNWVSIINTFDIGYTFTKEHLVDYNVDKILEKDLDKMDLKGIFKLFDMVDYKDVKPDYMLWPIRCLINRNWHIDDHGYEFVIYSKCMGDFETAQKQKLEWLSKHLPMEKVRYVKFEKYERLKGIAQEKDITGHVMIDDNPKTLELFLWKNPNSLAILVDQPWNRDYKSVEGMIRVSRENVEQQLAKV